MKSQPSKDSMNEQYQRLLRTSWIQRRGEYVTQTQSLLNALTIALKRGWIPTADGLRPSPKQLRFLLLPEKEGFYGGAAGGGKSDALLMGAIMYSHIPGYNAILFRKSLQDHKLPEGLIPRSKEWLMGKAHWNGSEYRWTFPSNATITFGYLDGVDDHYRYQSSAYQYIGFDEMPHFRERQVRYMFSRLRRLETHKHIPLRIRGAGNPDGRYVQWVKNRYVDPGSRNIPFVPAKLEDNPGLDKESYIDSLMNLDPVTRARLLDGNWEMKDVGAMFRRSWFTLIKTAPAFMDLLAVRYWDKASTTPRRGIDPDWTAGVLMATLKGRFYILDVRHMRGRPAEVEALIKQTALLDKQRKFKSLTTYMEQEPGSAGVDVIDHYTRTVLPGTKFKPDKVTGSKAERAGAFSSMAEAKNVYIVLGTWNITGYLDELEAFPGVDHDDRVDASSGAFNMLNVPRPKAAWAFG